MHDTTCPDEARLFAFLQGELPEGDLQEIAAHVENCLLCELAAQELDGVSDPVLDALRQPTDSRHECPAQEMKKTADTMVFSAPAFQAVHYPARVDTQRCLGKYALLEELGRGGMGVVYKAWHPELQRFVALKVIRAGDHASAEEMIRFRREAEMLARLSHPNLLQIYEIGQHEDFPFLALEYVSGGSLDRRLAGQPQPARFAAELAATLAEAVHAAHEAGVIHRDLKPANVLLAGGADLPIGQCTPKVSDFGLAKKFGGAIGCTASNVVTGTPGYMAPEQVSAPASVGPAADVYALGAILYELQPFFLGFPK